VSDNNFEVWEIFLNLEKSGEKFISLNIARLNKRMTDAVETAPGAFGR
jgi:hypothetical protein